MTATTKDAEHQRMMSHLKTILAELGSGSTLFQVYSVCGFYYPRLFSDSFEQTAIIWWQKSCSTYLRVFCPDVRSTTDNLSTTIPGELKNQWQSDFFPPFRIEITVDSWRPPNGIALSMWEMTPICLMASHRIIPVADSTTLFAHHPSVDMTVALQIWKNAFLP